ncbi:glycerol acyltransferase [Solitalea longa]|uniref:Glycerol acyltransferase n=1 Tax=Solitalea longa TaxID=2079460 RepID=A0A2S5A200_9SPHI|nr:1-acyl-sn-glycerol-3-phosphate acyltransferase [Solitalea longa]POY36554.1 glycerol acyltransferase [Solitalea longa]
METLFIKLYNYFEKRRAALYIWLSLCFLVSIFFALRLQFEEDISKVLPKDKKIDKMNQVFQNSKFMDKLVLTVSLKDTLAEAQPDSLVAYANELNTVILEKMQPYVAKVNFKVDDDMALQMFNNIQENLPIYLNENDYKHIDSLIEPKQVEKTVENNYHILSSPAGFALKNMIINDPVGITFLGLKKLQQLQYDASFELYDNCVVTKDHKHLLMFITPVYPPNNTGKNDQLLTQLDKSIDSLNNSSFRSINTSYFGAAAVAVGNAKQLRKDTMYTQGLTVLFLILFIGFYFRKKRAPFIILLPVVFGTVFSLALIYLIKGNISVIALGTGCVVFGIAVNYSLHVFNHYRHVGSMHEVLKDLSFPLTIGGLTTIGGFLCLQFVKSEMLKDLGLFAALNLIGASLFSLVFLPHLIRSKNNETETEKTKLDWLDKISNYRPEKNKGLLAAIAVITLVLAYTSQWVGFEADMNKMNFMSDKVKKDESDLNRINAYSLQSVYLVSEGKDLNDALQNNEKINAEIEQLKQKGIVKKYSGVSSLIISDSIQKIRIARWNAYWTPLKKQQLLTTLKTEGAKLKFKASAFNNFENLLDRQFTPVSIQSQDALRKNFLDDYITEKKGSASVVTLVKIDPKDKHLLYSMFEKNEQLTVIDKQYLTSRFVEIINQDFSSIALMSSILVLVVLLLTYGRIELALVSFIPMAITWVWILGLMGLFGIKFNIINIIISALIFGLGDDYSLFIMDGLLQEYKTGKKNLSSFKSSIILSAITTIAGLGVLIFAKHPALKSIALISIIGILCVVIISQVLIPFLFNILIKNRVHKHQNPWTFFSWLKSVFAFSYFVFGCLLLSVLGCLIIKLNPFKKVRAKYIYHFILSKFAWSMMYIMGNVKKEIINEQGEDFAKPAVIVSNHQSFLDILTMIMLHPKLVLLTNSWVWNSPFFGFVVRMADYYPVDNGAENSIALLEAKVKQGYSVVVFPEGTRTLDGTMKRFHKGAFYLAEQLQLDILPIVLHGTGYTMSKGDFLLKDGTITVKFLPRISLLNTDFGETYTERAKQIGRYFRKEFALLRSQIEGPEYYKEQLIYKYLYKGPVLEWYMKVKLKLEKNYHLFHELVPAEGKVLDMGCGYGFMSYMLHYLSPKRVITGVDYDEEKIDTANYCFGRSEEVQFAYADITTFEFDQQDVFILSDMLHYLQPVQQKQLIERCIDKLNAGGSIIIRDGNKDDAQKHKRTKLTEFFSTRFVGFNKTIEGTELSFFSADMIRAIADERNLHCSEIQNSKYTSNVVFVLKDQMN